MKSLEHEVASLIALKKEGDHWDFKLKHHSNFVDLLKDIICLANNIFCNGDRYLIFGINPQTYKIEGVKNKERIFDQAKIIDGLRGAGFSASQIPDIKFETLSLKRKKIDVLIIKDRPHKPYYLEKERRGKNSRTVLLPGTIYSRNCDSNTSNDKIASSGEIQSMWAQRFGLDLSPLDRFSIYVEDKESWESIPGLEDETLHYRQFPEFTVVIHNQKVNDDFKEDWTQNFPDKKAESVYVDVKYHATILERTLFVHCDGWRHTAPAPRFQKRSDDSYDYYYVESDLSYRLYKLIVHSRRGDQSRNEMDLFFNYSGIKVVNALPAATLLTQKDS